MRELHFFGLCFFLISSGHTALPLPTPIVEVPEICVPKSNPACSDIPASWLTWNLEWFPGRSPDSDGDLQQGHIRNVRTFLRKIFPDAAIFQEVVSASALSDAAGDYPWRAVTHFQRAADEDEKLPPQNIALVSRKAWREVWELDFHQLPVNEERPVRGFIGAEFIDPADRRLTVYGVHLKSNRGGREASLKRREKAMEYLRWDWRRRNLDPLQDAILIAGDFNCSLKNAEFVKEKTIRGLLKQGWISVTHEMPWPQGATVRENRLAKYPPADFDHILLSPGWIKSFGRNGEDIRVFRDKDIPSDHFPLWMKVK
ncbi:MAG: endonuclease/exonuclease/phosphatase family protein [Verrucomicrobia bacterium]|nr:endonuclease/exonuclease/phosphatase family protein [Verrucomicrobiota bacterium]